MRPGAPPVRRIGIVGQSHYAGLRHSLGTLRDFGERHGLDLFVEDRLAEFFPHTPLFVPGQVDLLLAFGGDGTLLRGARLVAPHHTPVLGVNMGNMGFLTSVSPDDLVGALESVLAGRFWLDVRLTLTARVIGRAGEAGASYLALNDAVLHKGGFARAIRLAVYVGEEPEPVGAYLADGIVLSTPTGSTAYSLSAGGPIVVPEVDCILATPICPHTLAVRPLVVPASAAITVEVLSNDEQLMLTVDGQEGEALEPGDRLVVRRGEAAVPLVRFPGQSFFSTLRRKLHWGGGEPAWPVRDPSGH